MFQSQMSINIIVTLSLMKMEIVSICGLLKKRVNNCVNKIFLGTTFG